MNKDEWKIKLEKEYGWPNDFKFNFDVNEWGSCQYSSALAIFELFFEIRKDLDQQETLEILGCNYNFNYLRKFFEIQLKFLSDMMIDYSNPPYNKTLEELNNMKLQIEHFYSIDDMFVFLKNKSWDLWGSAPYIAETIYDGFELVGVIDSPGIGPSGNVIVQSENFRTGIICAILFDNDLIKSFYSFANFDT